MILIISEDRDARFYKSHISNHHLPINAYNYNLEMNYLGILAIVSVALNSLKASASSRGRAIY